MQFKIFSGLVILLQICTITSVELDIIDCGVDHALDVAVGDVELRQYPWVGILYYSYFGEEGDSRAITTVILIHREFVVAPASDIGPMPKTNFRRNSRVLLGQGWNRPGLRVRNYVLHPEYGETYNTIALVQLTNPIKDLTIKPACPPPNYLRNPTFYVIKMKEDFTELEKEVVSVMHVPGDLCKDFYVAANLYSKLMRPPHVACAVSVNTQEVCVWGAGAALVARDAWGRWQLLGMGVRGPGCGAPSRYLDMMSYYPWIENSLSKFSRISISKINKQKYVLRTSTAYQRYGACDPEEKINIIYREVVVLRTDNNQYQFMQYNLTVIQEVEYSCLTMELVNASAVSEMKVFHVCTRESRQEPCYRYFGSKFEISVYLMFSDKCTFEMNAWGYPKSLKLIDIQEWKWEEGTYYEDFNIKRVEYRGPTYMTEFGYEPLDIGMWVPEYDIWTTTEEDNSTTPTSPPVMVSRDRPSRPTTTQLPTRKTPRRRTRTKATRPPTVNTTTTSTTRPTTTKTTTTPTTTSTTTRTTTTKPPTTKYIPPPTTPTTTTTEIITEMTTETTPPPTPETTPPPTPETTPPPTPETTPPAIPPTTPPTIPPTTPPTIPETTPPTIPPTTPQTIPPTTPPTEPPTTPRPTPTTPPTEPPTTPRPTPTHTPAPPPLEETTLLPVTDRLTAMAGATMAHAQIALISFLALMTYCL